MFGWFKKSPPRPAVQRNILHGHDLNKWNYLGYMKCEYIDEHGNTTRENPVFLFAHKEDESKRSYKITGALAEDTEKYHGYVTTTLMPWKSGEGSVYALVAGESAKPSDYLKGYMLEKFGCVWSDETNWWQSTSEAKHRQATIKQRSSKQRSSRKKKTETTADDNVIKVDFNSD